MSRLLLSRSFRIVASNCAANKQAASAFLFHGGHSWDDCRSRSFATTTTPTTSTPSPIHGRKIVDENLQINNILSMSMTRQFSSLSLRRPPAPMKHDAEESASSSTSSSRKWRTHVISFELGDYSSDDSQDDDLLALSSRSSTTLTSTSTSSTKKYNWQEEELELAKEIQQLQQEEQSQRQKWKENAKPPERKPMIDERGRAYGRGGRKTASARVWIEPGLGQFVVNQQTLVDYFDRSSDRELILQPLLATETCGKLDVVAMVQGGGLTGQAGAIRHGLARALNHYNPELYRPPLKRLGYLTRDPRKVERKKIGHVKARKKPQWVKR